MTSDEQSGRVCVSIETPASAEAAFEALAQPAGLASWFGAPTTPLIAGGTTRVELGDGDFFSIDVIAMEPPVRLAYESRFLGLGARDRIGWSVTRNGTRTLITVTDEHPGRSAREVAVMRAGWRDFLDRLQRYLADGRSARYDWRRDLDGGVELPGAVGAVAARLFGAAELDRWQPWRATAWRSGASLEVPDGESPSTLHLAKLERGETELRLVVTAREWQQPTRVRLALVSHRGGSLLTFSHMGWGGIDARDDVQRLQRKRFCGLWIESLTRARALLGET
jgi:uncharacterized protein YndB with AHSA1/START domain